MSSLPAQALREIDRVCTRFEAAWKSGERPRLEEHFSSIHQAGESSVLFKELLLLELDYRARSGEQPSADEYASRFPQQSDVVADVWRDHRIADADLPEIAGYEVLRRIGRGGMATVYLARDRRLGRMVALKLISAPEPNEQLIARLRAEAHAIARLQHPNIVQIYEIGQRRGQPYLALEYVEGGSLAEWIAGNPRPARDAATLVEVLARAVHAAHQHGVVHRDLKPANVLLHQQLHPKITDFGLVKFLDDADPRQTQSGVMVGTASYMAPEQAGNSKGTVSAATDIYALGAILYELITGRPPFKAPTVIQTVQLVQNSEPVAPRQLQPHTPRDLETVCLKCLQKDPSRRYASAIELADDLARFLKGEPVHARPVGSIQRAWRWSQRNRAVAAMAAAVAVVVLLGSAVSVFFAMKANRRAAESQERRQHAEAVSRFMVNLFRSADPHIDGGKVTVADSLERGAKHLDIDFPDKPLIHAELADAIGHTYLGLGLNSQGLDLLEKAHALFGQHASSDDRRALSTLSHLALAHRAKGDLQRALTLSREAFDRTRAARGDDHADTIEAAVALAMVCQETGQLSEAGKLHEMSLAWTRKNLGENDPATLTAMSNLAWIYLRTGRVEQAIGMYEQALDGARKAFGPDHPSVLANMNGLAQAYSAAGQFEQAIAMFEQVLAGARVQLGEDHPNTLATMGGLARTYREARQFDKAIPLTERALERSRAKLGEDHPDTINDLASLAVAYDQAGKVDQALPIYEEVLRKRRARLGDDHPNTIMSMRGLGQAYRKSGKLELAEATLREGLEIAQRTLPDDWSTSYMRVMYGVVLADMKRFDEAEPNLLHGYEGLNARIERIPPSERRALTNALKGIVKLYDDWGKPESAAPWRDKLSVQGSRL